MPESHRYLLHRRPAALHPAAIQNVLKTHPPFSSTSGQVPEEQVSLQISIPQVVLYLTTNLRQPDIVLTTNLSQPDTAGQFLAVLQGPTWRISAASIVGSFGIDDICKVLLLTPPFICLALDS